MPEVLYEDNHLLVVNKPAGILVHGDQTGDLTLLRECKSYIKNKYEKPGNVFLQPCHRLDRPVSGVLVFARTSKAIDRMNALFRKQQVTKVYWAMTDRMAGIVAGEVNNLMLLKDRKRNVVKVVGAHPNAQSATTHYRLLADAGNTYLWELLPQTGRSHQLRVTMKHLGMPIIGDLKYGHAKGLGSYIALHCYQLSFIHPVSKSEMTIECSPPDEYPWSKLANV